MMFLGDKYMNTKICKVISYISSVIVYVYGILNLLSFVLMKGFSWEQVGGFVDSVFTIDLFSWLIFGIFTVIILLFKLNFKEKVREERVYSKFLKVDIVLHIIFSIVSFANIVVLFSRAF